MHVCGQLLTRAESHDPETVKALRVCVITKHLRTRNKNAYTDDHTKQDEEALYCRQIRNKKKLSSPSLGEYIHRVFQQHICVCV